MVGKKYDKLLIECGETFGIADRLAKAKEEFAEAIAAIQHYESGRPGGSEEVVQELAHVILAARGAILAIGFEAEVEEEMHRKALEIEARLQKAKLRGL
jgi:hypothetical protein